MGNERMAWNGGGKWGKWQMLKRAAEQMHSAGKKEERSPQTFQLH